MRPFGVRFDHELLEQGNHFFGRHGVRPFDTSERGDRIPQLLQQPERLDDDMLRLTDSGV